MKDEIFDKSKNTQDKKTPNNVQSLEEYNKSQEYINDKMFYKVDDILEEKEPS